MFNVCPNCGLYSEDKTIDPQGPFTICPYCQHAHRFLQLALFVITGASSTGKTTICLELASQMPECVFLECDIFWRPSFATPEDDYYGFRNLCLRAAKNINQAGRPAVLCGSAIPKQYEVCKERRYFSETHYLAMVCDDDVLTQRLQNRPRWRESGDLETVRNMLSFNQWFKDNAQHTEPPMTLLDTSHLSVVQGAQKVTAWIRDRLA